MTEATPAYVKPGNDHVAEPFRSLLAPMGGQHVTVDTSTGAHEPAYPDPLANTPAELRETIRANERRAVIAEVKAFFAQNGEIGAVLYQRLINHLEGGK